MSTLFVANDAQRIIFEQEMKGQLSDGHWENSSPRDHWKPWCDAEVKVNKSGLVGRTFWASKDNYNFSAPDLLAAVGSRIINKVRAHMLGFSPEAVAEMPDDLQDYENWHQYAADEAARWSNGHSKGYWAAKIEKLNSLGVNAATMAAIEQWDGYTKRDLKADLAGLKTACRTKLSRHLD